MRRGPPTPPGVATYFPPLLFLLKRQRSSPSRNNTAVPTTEFSSAYGEKKKALGHLLRSRTLAVATPPNLLLFREWYDRAIV
jgi:hypothetical protein